MPASLIFRLRFFTLPCFSPIRRGLRWHTRLPTRLQFSSGLRTWLLDSGSLTAKLIRLSQGDFQVEVLRQWHGRAHTDEALALGIPLQQRCLIREVVLKGRNQPWVFARSLLPLTSLTGPLRHLRKQTNKPLGAFLFSQPHLQRSPIALTQISRHHAYVPTNLMGDSPVWGRRSVFSLRHRPLLVSEVFLADFCRAANCLIEP